LTQPATIFYQAKTVLPEKNMQASHGDSWYLCSIDNGFL